MKVKKYTATLHTPLFYSSSEGRIIETDKYIATTALMFSLGYKYFDMIKHYVLTGSDEASRSDYKLKEIPIFTSEMKPKSVQANERTIRGTNYHSEFNIVTGDDGNDLPENIDYHDNQGVPHHEGDTKPNWKKIREYNGLSPGSEFQYTIWGTNSAIKSLPETLRFKLGIKLSGDITATEAESPDGTVSVNEHVLKNVYDVPNSVMERIRENSQEYSRGNKPLLNRYIGISRPEFTKIVDEYDLHRKHN